MIDHLWQSTLFGAGVWILTLAVRRNSAGVRYRLWMAASLKFLVPLSALVSLGSRAAWRSAPVEAPAVWPLVVEEVFSPQASLTAAPSNAVSIVPHTSIRLIVLAAIWIAGTVAVLFLWWREWREIRAIVRRATPEPSIGGAAGMPVMASSDRVEPGLVGIWRPVLLLPSNIRQRVSPAALEAILAHEACHRRRRDNLTAAIHMAVEAIFWFHPGVWWIERRLVEERERACDEAVLLGGAEPRAYAEAILNVCRYYVESPSIAAAGVTGANLKRRIEAILHGRRPDVLSRWTRALIAAFALSALVGPFAIGAIAAARPASASAQAPTSPSAPLSFQAASIKANTSLQGDRASGFQPGGRFIARNMPLRNLIAVAYGEPSPLPLIRVVGGPDWADSDRFDVEAKADTNFPDTAAQPGFSTTGELMLRALLSRRFKLAAHVESRDMAVYALVPLRRDRMIASTGADCTMPPVPPGASLPPCGLQFVPDPGANLRHYRGRNVTMEQLARSFSAFFGTGIDRVIVDRTGLAGGFSFDLRFSPPSAGGAPAADTGVSIFTAFQEELGLRLEATRAPVSVVVIDHAERLQQDDAAFLAPPPPAPARAALQARPQAPRAPGGAVASAPTATVAGTAIDSFSRAPLAGVAVEVATEDPPNNPRTVTTDATGAFSVAGLAEGTYIVTFHTDDYVTFKREGLRVPAGATVTVAAAMRFSPIRD